MESNPEPQEPQELSLTIKANPDGTISVVGPISQKGLCYGLLEMARDAIFEHHLKQATNTKITPANRIMNFVRSR